MTCTYRLATTNPAHTGNLLIRRFPSGRPGPFRLIRDLGQGLARALILVRTPGKSFGQVAPSLAPGHPGVTVGPGPRSWIGPPIGGLEQIAAHW